MMIIASIQDFTGALVHLAGFLFVLFVLSLLWLIVEAVGAYFRKCVKPKAAPAPIAPAAIVPGMTASNSDELPEEDLVIIASTVAMLLGNKAHRLVSIRSSSMDWGREGRRQLLQSHRIGK